HRAPRSCVARQRTRTGRRPVMTRGIGVLAAWAVLACACGDRGSLPSGRPLPRRNPSGLTSGPGALTVVARLARGPGTADGVGSAARFNSPFGVAVDSTGNVYVADTENHTIRKTTPGGTVSTLAGGPGLPGSANGAGSAARFNRPFGLAVDSTGNLYVAD